MGDNHKIQIFDGQNVRTTWSVEEEKWYFSIVDVCSILTNQPDYDHARNYWKVLKHRLIKEGNETVTNCNQLKMLANEGKMLLKKLPTICLQLTNVHCCLMMKKTIMKNRL